MSGGNSVSRAEKVIREALADTIIGLRREEGISQDRLAFMAGLNRTYMGKIERAEANPSVHKLVKIFEALGTDPARILKVFRAHVKKRRKG